MEFVSLLFLILLTLAGYSSGNVLGAPGRKAVPAFIDLPITLAMWTAALAARPQLGRGLGILFGFGLGLALGLLLGALRRGRLEVDKNAPAAGFRAGWRAQWRAFNARLGEFQSRIFLTWFYFLLVTPFGLLTRFTSDRLHLRPPKAASMWLERPPAERPDEARARRQF
ncbi:MAG: hypothetical protein HYZ26_09345 [Chloroflexi bacterium]|nr:hypothetical protein [Chloroflexota bacterium]